MEYSVCVKGIKLEHVEFKHVICLLNDSDVDNAECRRNVLIGRRVASAIRSLVNDKSLLVYCLCLFLCMVVRQ